MKTCPICESSHSDSIEVCDCGYDFEEMEIVRKDRIRDYVAKLSKSKQWVEEIRLKKRLNDIQSKKKYDWSERKTANLLGERNSLTSPDIRLSEALDSYPELLNSRNKTAAHSRLKKIKKGIVRQDNKVKFEKEYDLQEYFEQNWNNIPLSKDWNLLGKYDAGEIGKLDLLARHKKEQKWLVIELKKDSSSDVAVGQILRYMGWVKLNLAHYGKKFKDSSSRIHLILDFFMHYCATQISD